MRLYEYRISTSTEVGHIVAYSLIDAAYGIQGKHPGGLVESIELINTRVLVTETKKYEDS